MKSELLKRFFKNLFRKKDYKILFLQFDLVIDKHGLEDKNNYFGDSENMKDLFTSIINNKLENSTVNFHNYEDISKIGRNYYINNLSLNNYDFVFFGFVKRHTTIATLLHNYFTVNNVPTLLYGTFDYVQNKAYDMELIEKLKYPYIPSILTTKINESVLKHIDRNFKYPVVVKDINLDKGTGVFKFNNKEDLLKKFPNYYNRIFLVQKFIQNTGDYRVIVLKNKAILCVKKEQPNNKEFRNNIANGSIIVKSKLPEDVILMCEDISKHIKCDIIGIDVIYDEVDKIYYIMEINAAPGFPAFSIVSGVNVAEVISNYIISNIKKM